MCEEAAKALSKLEEAGIGKRYGINKEEMSKVKIMTTEDAVRVMEEELNIKIVIVPKEDILRKNFVNVEPILFYLTEKIKEAKKFPVLIRILVDGYNEDPRLLLEIPEVIEWFGELHSKYSYLPYFLDEETIPLYFSIVAIYKDKRGITPTKAVINELGEFFGKTYSENDFRGSMVFEQRERTVTVKNIARAVTIMEIIKTGNALFSWMFPNDENIRASLINEAARRINSSIFRARKEII